jgi:hypothetical protein
LICWFNIWFKRMESAWQSVAHLVCVSHKIIPTYAKYLRGNAIHIWDSVKFSKVTSTCFAHESNGEYKTTVDFRTVQGIVRLVLVLRPAHHLMAPSTEPRTRTYEVPIHPNQESKLPNPDSHQNVRSLRSPSNPPHRTYHLRHTASAPAGDPDLWLWVLMMKKAKLRSVWVFPHGWLAPAGPIPVGPQVLMSFRKPVGTYEYLWVFANFCKIPSHNQIGNIQRHLNCLIRDCPCWSVNEVSEKKK